MSADSADTTDPANSADWLSWTREATSIAREGLTYSSNPFDRDRYRRLEELAVRMTAGLVGGPPAQVRMYLDGERGYITPKLDVRAAVSDERGRLLLVRETHDGRWSLPGGWADVNQTLAEGAVREVREESGFEVVAERLLGVYDRERWGHPPMPWYTLKAVLACRVVGGEARQSHETDAVAWFARDEIPDLSVPRTSARLVARVFEHLDDPGLPPDL